MAKVVLPVRDSSTVRPVRAVMDTRALPDSESPAGMTTERPWMAGPLRFRRPAREKMEELGSIALGSGVFSIFLIQRDSRVRAAVSLSNTAKGGIWNSAAT